MGDWTARNEQRTIRIKEQQPPLGALLRWLGTRAVPSTDCSLICLTQPGKINFKSENSGLPLRVHYSNAGHSQNKQPRVIKKSIPTPIGTIKLTQSWTGE